MSYDKEIEEILKKHITIEGHTYDDTLKAHCERIARMYNEDLETKIIKEVLMNSSVKIVNKAVIEYSEELNKITNIVPSALFTEFVMNKDLSIEEIKQYLTLVKEE